MYTMGYFQSLSSILMNDIDMVTPFDDALSSFDKKVEQFTDVGSGWKVDTIDSIRVYTAPYETIGGSSYIPLPKWILDIKITNTDNYCFPYSVLAASHPQIQQAERVGKFDELLPELKVQ